MTKSPILPFRVKKLPAQSDRFKWLMCGVAPCLCCLCFLPCFNPFKLYETLAWHTSVSFPSQPFSSILTTHWNNSACGVSLYFQTQLDWLALRSSGLCLMLCSHICSTPFQWTTSSSRAPAACTLTHSCYKLCELAILIWLVFCFFFTLFYSFF